MTHEDTVFLLVPEHDQADKSPPRFTDKGETPQIENKESLDELEDTASSDLQAQEHEGGPALELEEHSQDRRFAPRVNGTCAERQEFLAYQNSMVDSIYSTRWDVKLEESNTTSRPAENKRSDFELEEPSKLNFQR